MHFPPDDALEAGRDALFEWTVQLHNLVNESLAKPSASTAAMAEWYSTRWLRVVPASRFWLDVLGGAMAALVMTVLVTWTVLKCRRKRAR